MQKVLINKGIWLLAAIFAAPASHAASDAVGASMALSRTAPATHPLTQSKMQREV
jgi:hypothetical protein